MNRLLILLVVLSAFHATISSAAVIEPREPRSMTRIQEIFRYLGPQTNSRGKKLYVEPYELRLEDQW